MKTLAAIKEKVKQERHRVAAVANAAEKQILQAVKTAMEEDLCGFLLFGNQYEITDLANKINLDITSPKIRIEHTESVEESAIGAVKAVHSNQAEILMKGNLSTKELMKPVLNQQYGLRTGKVLSHVALFEIPNQHKLYFLTDAAMNISPTMEEKAAIIKNAVKTAHSIGIDVPKVAVIAAVESVNTKMEATVDAAALTQMQKRGQLSRCLVDGPLAFDIAISKKAADHKGIHSDVAGSADILLVPSIETGNALYKSFVYFARAKVAGIISGAKAPIIVTSRADAAEDKLYSLTLALISARKY
ncbi:phosphate butyryltransferase [Virgibacillus sp. YIM 98842]|mgnify:CR=1 FL=1|jgi:phosphate butyryltransferase|uniref:phosphate butyryltransferase n=1 Tax=Virgibacillus sp. YIM 98842 TaxID=2663533 RepID=UPI0013DD197D|nr:phosphate butyryltransferase [Virgibacillus sp. YIM 98842]